MMDHKIAVVVTVFSLFLFFGPVFASEKIDINSAPLEDLVKIIHIGEVRARELISLRPFSSLDDLAKITGIGEKRIEDIKNQGLAWLTLPESEPGPQSGPGPQIEELPSKDKTGAEERLVEGEEKEAQETEPEINLLYPQDNPVNKEIEAFFSSSNLKNASYDVKISIEKEKVLSDVYNEKRNEWHSSHYYINNLFSGSSFEKTFRLKIREENLNFQGEADILVRIRENGKSGYLEYGGKINVTEPERHTEDGPLSTSAKDLTVANRQTPGLPASLGVSLTAFSLAVFSGTIILILKKKLKQ